MPRPQAGRSNAISAAISEWTPRSASPAGSPPTSPGTPTSPRWRPTRSRSTSPASASFFPEKREFFLEGQGIFDFGASGGRGAPPGSTRSFGPPSSTPVLFFSRRIGIENGSAVPITGGARVTGKLGDYNVGAIAMRSGESAAAGSPETDFSVFRLKRDILNRSTVGVMGTYRSHTASGLGRNFAYGMDARFGFFENLDIRSYAALDAERNRGGDRAELPRPARLQRGPLRTCRRNGWWWGTNSTPGSGSCAGWTSSGTTRRPGSVPGPTPSRGCARSAGPAAWTTRRTTKA